MVKNSSLEEPYTRILFAFAEPAINLEAYPPPAGASTTVKGTAARGHPGAVRRCGCLSTPGLYQDPSRNLDPAFIAELEESQQMLDYPKALANQVNALLAV